jgi:DNA-directed RNA polymerase subunit RPC12/RpoP
MIWRCVTCGHLVPRYDLAPGRQNLYCSRCRAVVAFEVRPDKKRSNGVSNQTGGTPGILSKMVRNREERTRNPPGTYRAVSLHQIVLR